MMPDFAKEFVVIIPVRYASTRLPGKPLLKIGDRTLIRHVCDRALESSAGSVFVATDDQRIADHLADTAITVVMTSTECQSGTDRIAEASRLLNLPAEAVIVNLQGDEPFMPPGVIDQIAHALISNAGVHMSTGCEQIKNNIDWNCPDIVKVTRDKNDLALYFSRSVIPFSVDKHDQKIYKHLGIYSYSVDYLKKFASLAPCRLEQSEKLEQLRALYNGDRIIVPEIYEPTGIGVDTPEDLDAARKMYEQRLIDNPSGTS